MRKRCAWIFTLLVTCLLAFPGLTGNLHADDGENTLLNSLQHSSNLTERRQNLDKIYRYYMDKRIFYRAQSYLSKLIQLQKNQNDFSALEISYRHLGEIYEEKQEYQAALNHYFEALTYSQKLPNNHSGNIYLRISEVFRIINRMELSWKYLKKAMDYTTRHHDQDLKVFVLRSYSHLYYEEEDYTNALKFIDLSLKTENGRKKYLCTIRCLYQKALILFKIGETQSPGSGLSKNTKLNEAISLLKKAVDMGLKEKKYDRLLPIMGAYIEKLILLHQLAEAAKYLDRIDDIYAPFYTSYFIYYYLEAMLYEKQGQMNKARYFYEETAQHLAKFFSSRNIHQHNAFKKVTGKIYSRIVQFYLDMHQSTKKAIYLKKAIFFSEIKNAYIYELNTLKTKKYSFFLKEKKKLEQEFLEWNKKYLEFVKQDQGRENHGRRYLEKLESLTRQNEELTEFILEAPFTYRRYRFKDFRLSRIQARLTPYQQIIKFVVLERYIYVFRIDKHSITYRKLAGNTQEILEKVKQLTEPLDDFTRGQVDYLRINYNLQLAHHLYQVLLRDLLESRPVPRENELFIIPDKQLFKLPFEALVTSFNQNEFDASIIFSEYASADYLIQRYPVSYVLSLFHFQKSTPPPKDKPFALTAFGDPIINPNSGDHLFRSLPSSREEIMAIREIFEVQQSRVFLGPRFVKERFEEYAPRSEILHIATHFINNLNHPQYSALLFSRQENNSPYYYAHDIFRLRLNTSLVVLSACESSEKHLLGMQGLRGMTAAFRHAGVRSLMTSMWPVDQQSSRFTPLFYKEYQAYRKKGNPRQAISIASALRRAKLLFMQKTASPSEDLTISFAHPFLWANYILYTFSF
jgi:CHAT domain-containing protein